MDNFQYILTFKALINCTFFIVGGTINFIQNWMLFKLVEEIPILDNNAICCQIWKKNKNCDFMNHASAKSWAQSPKIYFEHARLS